MRVVQRPVAAATAVAPTQGLRGAFVDACPVPGWPCRRVIGDVGRAAFVGVFELDAWGPWLREASGLLDVPERARVERLRFARHREALTLSYALHRLLLGEAMGCDPEDVPLWRDARGCPRVGDGDWMTSLSHAPGCAAVAVATAGPIGVDIEPASRAPEMAAIVDRVCHPLDEAHLAPLPRPARDAALLELWVRKEAVLKAAGVGLEVEMKAFPAPRDGLVPLPGTGGTAVRAGLLDIGPLHRAALASPPGTRVEWAWWRAPAVKTAPARARVPLIGDSGPSGAA